MFLERVAAKLWPVGLLLASACEDSVPLEDIETWAAQDDAGDEADESPADTFPTVAPTTPPAVYDCDFTEDFEGPNGAPWPEPWEVLGGVARADLRNGWGRLQPQTGEYAVARMLLPLDCQEFDVTVKFILTDPSTQGAAIYGRQNGGHLQDTLPYGSGYCVFAENFREPSGVGLWREVNGIEQNMTGVTPADVDPLVIYKMRLQIRQLTTEFSLVQGKLWEAHTAEPAAWTVEFVDDTNALRKAAGSVALDAYTSLVEGGTGHAVYFDDLVVKQAFPDPPEMVDEPAFSG